MTAFTTGAAMFGWAGAALFAASLVYFLFTYAITFGDMAIGVVTARAVAIDVVLFSVFALHHSVFARARVRAWVARTCAPRLERSVYVWVASVGFILVCALWRPVPGMAWELRGPAAWLLSLLQLTGVWLTLRSVAIIDMWELAGVRQAMSIPDSQPPTPRSIGPAPDSQAHRDEPRSNEGAENRHHVATAPFRDSAADQQGSPERWTFRAEGPYAWVRHPIYLGWLLVVFPMATMTMTRLVFAVTSSVYILIGLAFEERSLRAASGGAYDAYRQQVPWKLLPGLY